MGVSARCASVHCDGALIPIQTRHCGKVSKPSGVSSTAHVPAGPALVSLTLNPKTLIPHPTSNTSGRPIPGLGEELSLKFKDFLGSLETTDYWSPLCVEACSRDVSVQRTTYAGAPLLFRTEGRDCLMKVSRPPFQLRPTHTCAAGLTRESDALALLAIVSVDHHVRTAHAQ